MSKHSRHQENNNFFKEQNNKKPKEIPLETNIKFNNNFKYFF